MDPHFARTLAAGKKEAWFQDQYCHPHETCHTIDEVLGWMGEAGLEFVNSIPKPAPGPLLEDRERLFAPHDRGRPTGRVLSQLASMGTGYREGGLFLIIGRKT